MKLSETVSYTKLTAAFYTHYYVPPFWKKKRGGRQPTKHAFYWRSKNKTDFQETFPFIENVQFELSK